MNESVNEALTHAYRAEINGRLDDAAAEYEQILERDLDAMEAATVRMHLGKLHFRLGHLRRARTHFKKASEPDPQNANLWYEMGVVDYHMADFDGAVDSLRHALEIDRNLHMAYFWLASALYHRGDLDDAAKGFRTLVEKFPNFTIARFHLGVIYARQGNKQAAEEEFRRVLLKNPEAAAARFYVSG